MATSYEHRSALSTRAGAVITLVGGAAFLAGVFLPLGEGRSLWVIQWRSGPDWEVALALYILPAVLIIGAAVVGLVAVWLTQAAGGVAVGLGLMSVMEWLWFRFQDLNSGVDWGTGWWALVLGGAVSLVGGVIQVLQTRPGSASAA